MLSTLPALLLNLKFVNLLFKSLIFKDLFGVTFCTNIGVINIPYKRLKKSDSLSKICLEESIFSFGSSLLDEKVFYKWH